MNIHDARKVNDPKRSFNFILFYHNRRKSIKKLFIFVLLLIILFFPLWSGEVVGNWIKDFLGTIINIIKTI